MKLLLLNTCGVEASVALADTALAEPVLAQVQMPGRTASERLVALVRETMLQADWDLRGLDAIAVVTGPGSFTGVRVGLSAAKGLSEAAQIPMIGVSRLAMLAATLGQATGRVCALLDAGREEFYCGQYLDGVELGESLVSLDEAVVFAGQADGVVVCEEGVRATMASWSPMEMVPEPGAADAFPIARQRLEDRFFDDPVTLDANYLRRTDAEIFSQPAKRRAS